MFKKLLKIFHFSGQSKKNDAELPKEIQEQLTKSIEAYKNRPIHKILTPEIIDITSDDDLLQVVFDNLSDKLLGDFEKEYETVMTWNKSQQAIYIIWNWEAEVNNGGFNQFYFNSSGRFYQHLPDALKLVGSKEFADLAERANKIYEQENDTITKHQNGTIEGFSKSYEDNPLNELDPVFFELHTEDLQEIQIEFIRKNKTEFIDN